MLQNRMIQTRNRISIQKNKSSFFLYSLLTSTHITCTRFKYNEIPITQTTTVKTLETMQQSQIIVKPFIPQIKTTILNPTLVEVII
jgi:hypothetical protein